MTHLLETLKSQASHQWRSHRSMVVFIALMLIFRSAVADWNEVPTGSMKPTIVEGDRILVNKLAYDVRVPFTHISLLELGNPQHGDIIVFDSKVSGKRLVKRVIGVPGDVVAMQHNRLSVNGRETDHQPVQVSKGAVDLRESLFGDDYVVRVNPQGTDMSSFNEVTVPDGHYLVLGDNRDNSADSRVIGFVPRDEIVGRTERVVVSFNYDNFYLPRKERFLHTL